MCQLQYDDATTIAADIKQAYRFTSSLFSVVNGYLTSPEAIFKVDSCIAQMVLCDWLCDYGILMVIQSSSRTHLAASTKTRCWVFNVARSAMAALCIAHVCSEEARFIGTKERFENRLLST